MEESIDNKRIKSQDEEDRISALPDSIIHHILSLLPSTKEAIRTSILSKRWRNQWTRVPVLIFDVSPFVVNTTLRSGDKDYRFIENTLLAHDCPKIKKFHLEYDGFLHPDPMFISKIRFAIRKCVEELILICDNPRGSFLLPQFLFDNASLVRLKMDYCHFMPNWRVNWPSLKSLHLQCTSLSGHNCIKGIENVVYGSPLLERLKLHGTIGDDIAIVSKSLKVLSIVEVKRSAAIEISCPNLVKLKVNWFKSAISNQMIENVLSGSPFVRSLKLETCIVSDKLVIASKSLKQLHLEDIATGRIDVSCPNLEKLHFSCRGGNIFKSVNLPSSICATLTYKYPLDPEHNTLVKRLLEQFQHVNKLTIGVALSKFISDLDVEVYQSLPILNIKCLTLNVGTIFGLALPTIAYALRSPKLETLVVKLDSLFHTDSSKKAIHDKIISRLDYWNSNGSPGFSCLVSDLKTVEIVGLSDKDVKYKLVLDFIEFLSKNARKLENMIVSLVESRTNFVVEVSQKLLSFRRYSRHANVELLCST